jgi:hypothetical protein
MTTKQFLILFLMFSALFVFNKNSVNAQAKNGDEITIVGEVIDVNCYMQDGAEATGPNHKECAIMCVKGGAPLAILTSDGLVYYPIAAMGKNPNDKLVDYIADKVTVKGKFYSQGGSNLGIKISSISKAE